MPKCRLLFNVYYKYFSVGLLDQYPIIAVSLLMTVKLFFAVCKLLNLTGLMTKCDIDCCEGDNCNAAVRISGLAACLLAVLLALLLN